MSSTPTLQLVSRTIHYGHKQQFELLAGDELLFTLELTRLSFLSDEIYVTMLPEPGLRAASLSLLRAIRKLFEQQAFGLWLVCQVDATDETALNWARFFGFIEEPTALYGRIQLVRK